MPRKRCRFVEIKHGHLFLYRGAVWMRTSATGAAGFQMGVDCPIPNGKKLKLSSNTWVESL